MGSASVVYRGSCYKPFLPHLRTSNWYFPVSLLDAESWGFFIEEAGDMLIYDECYKGNTLPKFKANLTEGGRE